MKTFFRIKLSFKSDVTGGGLKNVKVDKSFLLCLLIMLNTWDNYSKPFVYKYAFDAKEL